MCKAAVLRPAVDDAVDIVDGLAASHVAVFDDGVVVVGRGAQAQHILPDVTPAVGVPALLARQGHGVANVEEASVVACQHVTAPFDGVANVGEPV